MRQGVVPREGEVVLEVASRTDRGVSARGNALEIQSSLGPSALLRALNGIAPDLFFTAVTEVPKEFRVRHALRRRYRYFDFFPGARGDRYREAAERFAGEIDVRSFGRGLASSTPVLRTVEAVNVVDAPDGLTIEVIAPSFVWGMVRKIVAALREVDAGRLSLARLGNALRGRERLTLPLAEPEPLVLWDVEYALPWVHRWNGPNRHQVRWRQVAQQAVLERGHVLRALGGMVAQSDAT